MVNEMFRLAGKGALVTGGSGGIGAAIAKKLAEAGAEVAILARDKKKLEAIKKQIENEIGKKVWVFSFDLEDVEKAEAVFEDIVSQTGGVDILVNCAGVTRRAKAEDTSPDVWRQVMDVNLTAVMVMSQAFCKHRKKVKRGGRIVNIGSLMCHGARPGTSAYAASKAGVLSLTKSMAVEWAQYGINVNAIGPGYIETELTAELRRNAEFNKWVLSKTPLARWGRPEDLAGAAVFLASEASGFITGQILYVDGGWLAGL